MKIQVFSDTHFDFHKDHGKRFLSKLDPTDVDVLVVAGDLGQLDRCGPYLQRLCKLYPHVVYVPGNHDYYETGKALVRRALLMEQAMSQNLHVLDDNVVTIDGQRFVGSTLWYKNSPLAQRAAPHFTDFGHIPLFRQWIWKAGLAAQEFLLREVKADDIVVTHHVPTPRATSPKYPGAAANVFFITDMDRLIRDAQPKLWIFGHTHSRWDFLLGETRLLSNPYGYAHRKETRGFKWKLTVDV